MRSNRRKWIYAHPIHFLPGRRAIHLNQSLPDVLLASEPAVVHIAAAGQ